MAFDSLESQEIWRRTWNEDPAVGSIATNVLWENDRIRVWNLELAPGESSPLHTHDNPYLFVVIERARVLTKFPDGTTSDNTDPVGAAVSANLEDNARTHTLTNVNTRPYRNRVVEILRWGVAG